MRRRVFLLSHLPFMESHSPPLPVSDSEEGITKLHAPLRFNLLYLQKTKSNGCLQPRESSLAIMLLLETAIPRNYANNYDQLNRFV